MAFLASYWLLTTAMIYHLTVPWATMGMDLSTHHFVVVNCEVRLQVPKLIAISAEEYKGIPILMCLFYLFFCWTIISD